MINKKEESKSVSIFDGKWLINFDPDKKTGTKMANPFYDKFAGKSEKELKDFSKNVADAFGTDVKKIGTGEVLGKTCDIFESNTNLGGVKVKSKMWIYKNFIMKLDGEGMGTKTKEEVTVYKEGATPDAKLLTVPAGVKLTEVKIPFNK
jgi:outer membrane lipoprotein-sorting protein